MAYIVVGILIWAAVGCAVALLIGKAFQITAIREGHHGDPVQHTLTRA